MAFDMCGVWGVLRTTNYTASMLLGRPRSMAEWANGDGLEKSRTDSCARWIFDTPLFGVCEDWQLHGFAFTFLSTKVMPTCGHAHIQTTNYSLANRFRARCYCTEVPHVCKCTVFTEGLQKKVEGCHALHPRRSAKAGKMNSGIPSHPEIAHKREETEKKKKRKRH